MHMVKYFCGKNKLILNSNDYDCYPAWAQSTGLFCSNVYHLFYFYFYSITNFKDYVMLELWIQHRCFLHINKIHSEANNQKYDALEHKVKCGESTTIQDPTF